MVRRGDLIFGRVLVLLVATIFMSSFSSAALGIVMYQKHQIIAEGTSECVVFGAYNSLPGEGIDIEASVSDELKEFLVSINPETLTVPAETDNFDALPVEFCFEIPADLYADDKKCDGEQREFSGWVFLTEVADVESSGSATALSVSGSLNLKALCVPNQFNYSLLFVIIAIVLAVLVVILLIVKFKNKGNIDSVA